MLISDIRDYIATLGIAEPNNCYCGKLDSKPNEAIGIYNLNSGRAKENAIGGKDAKSYGTKAISLLVHWNKYTRQAEQAAIDLYKVLEETKNQIVNGYTIKFIELAHEEPISVDTDENGVYEYVIECLVYYERK